MVDPRSPFTLLSGFGIENLLKGIRIHQMLSIGEAVVMEKDGTTTLAGKLKTHDLVKLAADAEIALDEFERELLTRLTDFVVWAGRYPVGVAANKTNKGAGWYQPDDRDRVHAFAKRLTRFDALRAKKNRLDLAGAPSADRRLK